jgi:hypothetical protein
VLQRSWTKLEACAEPGCKEEARVAALLLTEMLKTEPAPYFVSSPVRRQPYWISQALAVPTWVRPLRAGGIVMLSVGGAAVLSSVSMFVMGTPPPGSPPTRSDQAMLFAGVGLLSTGLTMAVSGAVMVAIAQKAKKHAMIAPTLLPGGAGVTFQGSF